MAEVSAGSVQCAAEPWDVKTIVCVELTGSCKLVPSLSAGEMRGLACLQVNTDVQIVLEALGLADSKDAQKEDAALKDVNEILKPHMGVTWQTGNPNNKT